MTDIGQPIPGIAANGVGPMSVSNFIVGFLAMGVLLALTAYPLVHLFSVILPHHLPARRKVTHRVDTSLKV